MSEFDTVDAEYYFIQLLFCKNKDLLRKDYRDLYDATFKYYEKIYTEGREAHVDLRDINIKFIKKIRCQAPQKG